ncbi:MAG: DUF4435 domain-containing protein [Bacteroidales bacterium]|nr:DUF4435 domain-containing protein [Bacteroidales bacterium]
MSKRLTNNINSHYLDAANSLRPGGKKKKRIIAYVESYDDIFFWRSVLSEFENDEREFQVMLPSRTDLSRGKKQAMTNFLGEGLGRSMIACVDADYDWLMQGHTAYSRDMLNNPYIFHTYVYAIENYQCYAPSLHNVCVMATLNDRPVFDFEAYLRRYSQIVYDLFVWSVWLYRRQMYRDFPLNTFCNFVSVNKLNLFNPDTALEELRRTVNRKMAWMQHRYPKAKESFRPLKDELMAMGVRPDNVYLFVQGHHIMENVVMAVIDPACTLLRREREKEIKRLAQGRKQQMDNELASYQHSQMPILQCLRRNTQFKDSEPYQWLRADLRRFLGIDEATESAPF